MFLPILAALVASMALMKLGALAVMVAVMALALKLSIAVIFVLAGLLAWTHIRKS